MKICPKCQQIMEDSFEFCGRCGSNLEFLSDEESAALASSEKSAEEMSLQEINEALDKLVAEQNLKPDEDFPEEPENEERSEVSEESEFSDKSSMKDQQNALPLFGDAPQEAPRANPPLPGVREEQEEKPAPVVRRRPEGHRPPSIRTLRGEDAEENGSDAPARRAPTGHRPPSIRRQQGEDGAPGEDRAAAARRTPTGHRPPSVNRPPSAPGAGAPGGRPVGHRPPSVNRPASASGRPGEVAGRPGSNYGPDPERRESSDDGFTPIPPFMTAEEAARPSPFAPAKNSAFAPAAEERNDTKTSSKQDSAPSRSTYITSTAGELAASTKICPICSTRAFSSDKNCKGCGYQFPKAGAMSVFNEKSVNIVGILASIAMGASVFVNFINYQLNGSQVEFALISKIDGYAFLALAALGLVLSAFGRNLGVVTVGMISVLASWVENWFIYYDVTQVKKGGHIDNEIGFYLLVAGAALILISGIVGRVKEKKKVEKYMSYMNNSM